MRKITKFCLIIIIFLTSCQISQDQEYSMPESEEVVNKLLSEIAITCEKKYKIKTVGTNVSMPGGDVRLLGLDFQVRGPLSKEEIRKILLDLAHDFLEVVNSDEWVKPYLTNYPFEIKNIEIALFINDSKGQRLDDPYIGIAQIFCNCFEYLTLITTDISSIQSKFKETYEEALKLSMDSEKKVL